jgi:hypothetical protein
VSISLPWQQINLFHLISLITNYSVNDLMYFIFTPISLALSEMSDGCWIQSPSNRVIISPWILGGLNRDFFLLTVIECQKVMLMWVSLFVAMAMRLTHGGQLFDQTSGQDSKINLTLHRVLCVSCLEWHEHPSDISDNAREIGVKMKYIKSLTL